MLNRRLDLWLPAYLAGAPGRLLAAARRPSRLTHIIFLICDHFEPRHGIRRPEQAGERMLAWARDYARMQDQCRRDFGTAPLHTWFYPPHHGSEHIAALTAMAHAGLGEIELHYHHDGDTAATLTRDLQVTLAEYNRWGALLESGASPRTSFGFIHGDWALGNSCGGRYCGVNDELTILQGLGCWADFTMPSGGPCQTRKLNAIYYGKGDPQRPKAHDRGPDARVGRTDTPGLLLMQGPMGINWGAPRYPRIENASLTTANWGRPDRVRKWIDCNIHVRGRPEWLFVKLHTHGAIEQDFDALFGERAMAMHRYLAEHYNDGTRYRLHYVTARQAYNIAKAAEHGHGGDPSAWLDFAVPPPATAYYALDARHTLRQCTGARLVIDHIEAGSDTRLASRVGPLRAVHGPLRAIDIDASGRSVTLVADGELTLTLESARAAASAVGGQLLAGPGEASLRLASGGAAPITLTFRD